MYNAEVVSNSKEAFMPVIVQVSFRYPQHLDGPEEESEYLENLDGLIHDICTEAKSFLGVDVSYSVKCVDPEGTSTDYCSANYPSIELTADVPNDTFEDNSENIQALQRLTFNELKAFADSQNAGLTVYCWWKEISDQYPTFG